MLDVLWFERTLVWRHRKGWAPRHCGAQRTWPCYFRHLRIASGETHTGAEDNRQLEASLHTWAVILTCAWLNKVWRRMQNGKPKLHAAEKCTLLRGAARLSCDCSLSPSHLCWQLLCNCFHSRSIPQTALLLLWKYLDNLIANNLADTKVVWHSSSKAAAGNKGSEMKEICKWSLISTPTCLQCTSSFALVLSTNVLQ